jgi:hypothetical protein
MGLGERSRAPELMDSERVDLATFEACLKDLALINRWTGAYRITLDWLEVLRRVYGLRRLVRHNAAVSVERSCARRDWERLLATAGVAGPPTTVSWRFPFRYAVGRIKAP